MEILKYKYLKTVVLDSMKKVAFHKNIHMKKGWTSYVCMKEWLNY